MIDFSMKRIPERFSAMEGTKKTDDVFFLPTLTMQFIVRMGEDLCQVVANEPANDEALGE